ncbi:hypothetical protein EIP86_004637 [Pleurotus ostreatoroseus]|nr:hypothetical protein EIP86_004637 [Pleurotus ostreatoroseus]
MHKDSVTDFWSSIPDPIKAVLLAPGVLFDILLDRSSKRKVQAAVAWKRDERVFGVDVAGIVSVFVRFGGDVRGRRRSMYASDLRILTAARCLERFVASAVVRSGSALWCYSKH